MNGLQKLTLLFSALAITAGCVGAFAPGLDQTMRMISFVATGALVMAALYVLAVHYQQQKAQKDQNLTAFFQGASQHQRSLEVAEFAIKLFFFLGLSALGLWGYANHNLAAPFAWGAGGCLAVATGIDLYVTLNPSQPVSTLDQQITAERRKREHGELNTASSTVLSSKDHSTY